MSRQTARLALSRFHNQPVYLAPQHGPEALARDLALLASADFTREQDQAERGKALLVGAYGFNPQPEQQRKAFAYADGLAFIPVHGLLLNRFAYSWGWVTGYDCIRAQMHAALGDPDVKGLVFDVNSPGGMAFGCSELAEDIAKAGSLKPTVAVVDALSASAAYWLTSACKKVVLTPSGQVGSIGCVVMHVSLAGLLEQEGVKVTYIFAGKHKVDGNPYEVLSDSARAEIQASVDEAYASFVAGVAGHRGISEQAVRETEARVYGADAAKSLKLVDAVQPMREAVMSWSNELFGSDGGTEKDIMATATETVDAAAVLAAERARTNAILNAPEAEGREAQARHLATQTDLTAEQAIAVLATAPKAVATEASAFERAMDNSQQPNIGPGSGAQPTVTGQQQGNRLAASLQALGFKDETATTH